MIIIKMHNNSFNNFNNKLKCILIVLWRKCLILFLLFIINTLVKLI